MSSGKWRPFCVGINDLTIQVSVPLVCMNRQGCPFPYRCSGTKKVICLYSDHWKLRVNMMPTLSSLVVVILKVGIIMIISTFSFMLTTCLSYFSLAIADFNYVFDDHVIQNIQWDLTIYYGTFESVERLQLPGSFLMHLWLEIFIYRTEWLTADTLYELLAVLKVPTNGKIELLELSAFFKLTFSC